MQWHELLKRAEESEQVAREHIETAEKAYSQAIELAQGTLGPYDPNLGKCFLAFAQFLEHQNRFSEALLRYKLAASIYKQNGHASAHSLAKSKVLYLEELTAQEKPE